MTPEHHAKLQAIFEAALDLPSESRAAYLEEICKGNSELRSRVARLIAAIEDETDDGAENENARLLVRECPTCSRCYEAPTRTCSYDGTLLEHGFPGRLLVNGKYLIERRLGRGGMGAVYLVKHLGLEKNFALKLILSEGVIPQHARKRFETEARALGRLKHRNIVDVTDYGVDPDSGDLPYLVMEYLEGRTLSQLLRDRRMLPVAEAIPLLRAVADAIDSAHAQDIVHGDLKPANLFLARQENSSEVPKVVDFGLAQLKPSSGYDPDAGTAPDSIRSEGSGHARGTPAYMAPELFQGCDASPASDRFAFGAMTYEMLTGHSPFGRHLSEVHENQRQKPARLSLRNPVLPKELDAPVLALLERSPEDRPATAGAAVSEIEKAWLDAEQRKWRAHEAPRRLIYAAVAAILIVLLAGVGAGLGVFRDIENRTADARFALLPKHPPNPRLLVVAVDEPAIAENRAPLADRAWADDFSRTIESILAAGARGVAIDILLPANWSSSQELAGLLTRRAGQLVLAMFSTPSGGVVGTEPVGPLTAHLLGPEQYQALFGFVNLEEEEGRAIRHARLNYLDNNGQLRPSFAGRAATVASLNPTHDQTDSSFWIDYSVRPQDIPKISWKDAAGRVKTVPSLFRDKLVIIGADYAGSNDEHRVPPTVSSTLLSGVLFQALLVHTIAAGLPVRGLDLWVCMLAASVLCFATIALTLRFPHKAAVMLFTALAVACVYALLAFVVFRLSRTMIALAGPELALLSGIVAAWVLKSYLSPYPTAERLFPKEA